MKQFPLASVIAKDKISIKYWTVSVYLFIILREGIFLFNNTLSLNINKPVTEARGFFFIYFILLFGLHCTNGKTLVIGKNK